MLRIKPFHRIRCLSTQTPEQIQKNKEEAAKLAMQSMKDIGSMFSGSVDKETEVIDSEPIFQDPGKFASLSLLHQGQILQELQTKFDSKWTKLSDQDKRLGYYIYYGNWGVREKFDNWCKNEKPFDLPFIDRVRNGEKSGEKGGIVTKLPPHYLAETPVRKPQFDTKKMDPVTKFFIYVTLFVCVAAFYRDKKIGEDGKPQELVIRDLHEEQRQKQLEEEEQKKQKKWYYLWIK